MRIPRYTGQGVVAAEIQRDLAGQISPEEAAATAFGSKAVLAEGAAMFSNALAQVAQVRAREELASAQAELDARLYSLDQQLESQPAQVDANGNVVYTPGQIQLDEQKARKKIESEIRESLSGAGTKRRFDEYTKNQGISREGVYAAMEVKKQKEYMRSRLGADINEAMDRGDFDAALSRLDQSKGTLIGAAEYVTMRNEILVRRDQDTVLAVALNPNATDEDFDTMLDALETGAYEDGTDMAIDKAEAYRLRDLLMREREARLDGAKDQIQAAQRSTYASMYMRGLSQDLTVSQVMQAYSNDRLTAGDRDKLLALAEEPSLGVFVDTPAEIEAVESTYNNITLFGQYENVEEATDEFTRQVAALPITGDLKRKWIEKGRDDLQLLYNHPEVADLRRAAFASVTGVTEGMAGSIDQQIMQMQAGGYDEELEVAYRMQREIRSKALSLGEQRIRDGELEQWYEGKIDGYKIAMQEAVLSEIGVSVKMGADGFTLEKQNEARAQMVRWLMAQDNPGLARQTLRTQLDKIKSSTGVDIMMPATGWIDD